MMPHPEIIVRYCFEDPEKPDRWELQKPVSFKYRGLTINIPVGYVTDFASIPTLLWGIFPPVGRHNFAALVHDYWYDNRLYEKLYGAKTARKLADDAFLYLLNQLEPNKRIRNKMMYLACRWFGASWWRN